MNNKLARDDNRIYITFIIRTIVGIVIGIVLVGILNVIVDPYFHYHRPITRYRLNEQRYINDGIARHFDYDAIITGNSLTENFKPSTYNSLFGTSNCIKLPYSGAGYKEIWTSLDRYLGYNTNVTEVLVGFELEDMSRSASWERYSGAPEYLYDNKVFNDTQYIFNKSVLYRGTLYNILWTVLNNENTSFDDYSAWTRESGPKQACASLTTITEKNYSRTLSDVDLGKIEDNLTTNIVSVVSKYPDVTFKLVIPPSSVAKWAEYYSKGEVEWRIDGLEYALPIVLNENNIEVYAFDDVFYVTENLELYCDTIHYEASINELMLEEIAKNGHRVNSNNYKEYISRIREFYANYDYSRLNEYIED